MKSATRKPLAGIKVLDFTRILAGPFATQVLADLGATVIKVESPDGDDTRTWGPPFLSRENGAQEAAYFHSCNRGKHSLVVDLKRSEDLERVLQLVQHADIVVENFKVGGLKRFGLDFASLAVLNPELIYCSITGFGQSGPRAKQAGYDLMIQGLAGIMSLNGEADGVPQKMGVAFADVFTGIYSVIAVQSALIARQQSGQGTYIDMSLQDCMTGVLANQAMNYLIGGIVPKRMGNAHPNIVPYQVFSVFDGHVIIAVGNDGQFRRLCDVLGKSKLADDPRFETNKDRVSNRSELIDILEDCFIEWERDKLLDALERVTVPSGPIHDLDEALNDRQIVHRGIRIAPQGIPGLATPINFDGTVLSSDLPSPQLGSIGFDQALLMFENEKA